MTPRERDPQVWAATYGTCFVTGHRDAFDETDGGTPEDRTMAALDGVDVDRCKMVADAAVMALHPNGTFTAINGVTFAVPTDEGPASERGG